MRMSGRILSLLLLALVASGCISMVEMSHETVITPDYLSWSKSLDAERGNVRLYGMLDYASAQDLAQKILILDEAETPRRISIYVNSNGGEASGYRAILNAIQESHKPVDVIIIGNCYSAACAVLQSATGQRIAYANAHFMVHAPDVSSGNRRDLEPVLAFERQLYGDVLRERSNLPAEWFPLGRKMRFFTSDEALTYHFVDEVVEPANGSHKEEN